MTCFCREEFGISDVCDQGGERPLRHKRSGFGCGPSETDTAKAVEILMNSEQVLKIELNFDERYRCWDLDFETIPESCASHLCYYLMFQEG
jgi:hypothetical protein